MVLAFDRIIDNRTLRLITESSDSSPKIDKDNQDGSLRGNYVLILCCICTLLKSISLWFLYFIHNIFFANHVFGDKIWLRENKCLGNTLTINQDR